MNQVYNHKFTITWSRRNLVESKVSKLFSAFQKALGGVEMRAEGMGIESRGHPTHKVVVAIIEETLSMTSVRFFWKHLMMLRKKRITCCFHYFDKSLMTCKTILAQHFVILASTNVYHI